MSENQQNGALPGFEELVAKSGSIDLRDPRHTMHEIRKVDPDRFRRICMWLFKRAAISDIAEIEKVSQDAIRSFRNEIDSFIIDGSQVPATISAGLFYKNAVGLMRRKSHFKSMSALAEIDPKDCSVSELIALAKFTSDDDRNDSVSKKPIEVVEPTEDFEMIINGLVAEKRRALDAPAGETPAAVVEERSTENDSKDDNSLKMSHTRAKTLGVDCGLCNTLCNQSASGDRDAYPSADTPAAP